MFEQLAVFTPGGQVLYQHNGQGRKFAEQQINRFISYLISSPTGLQTDGSKKYSIVDVPTGSVANQKDFCAMYHVAKQPALSFAVTYAEQSLELNSEAENVLSLILALWNSLDINSHLQETHELPGILQKLDTYFKVKYQDLLKPTTSNNKSTKVKTKKNPVARISDKKVRKWGRGGMLEDVPSGNEISQLDFSESTALENTTNNIPPDSALIDKDAFGNRTEKGDFLIKEIDDLLTQQNKSSVDTSSKNKTMVSSTFSFLKKHVLGNKTITEDDLQSILDKLKQKLISKNVAPEAADFLATQVSKGLVGSKTANWTSVEETARSSLTKALTEILTPGVSVDLLYEIQEKTSKKTADNKKQPYVFSVVGVNGVGKSTNLSKLAFWLLKNNLKVLIVACDTFRSGAVEQLRVHVENLAQLTDETHVRGTKNKRGKSGNEFVELFEAGYGGSDLVTKIAKQAIKYAADNDFDIVLMDTAGRRHNDPTLMSPLKSFAEQAKPDKIIMVGEALVGTDSVQQARNFNEAFGKVRNLDFFIISKCDTVGEMLGSMVNMVYATGIPILFIGVGQTYTDLRTLSVNWAVNSLMS